MQVNTIEPLWTRKPSDIPGEEHAELYQSLSGRKDTPMYTMQFSVETPVSIKCVLYVPRFMPQLDISNLINFGILQEGDGPGLESQATAGVADVPKPYTGWSPAGTSLSTSVENSFRSPS